MFFCFSQFRIKSDVWQLKPSCRLTDLYHLLASLCILSFMSSNMLMTVIWEVEKCMDRAARGAQKGDTGGRAA